MGYNKSDSFPGMKAKLGSGDGLRAVETEILLSLLQGFLFIAN